MEPLFVFLKDVQVTKIVMIACAAVLGHVLVSNLCCATVRRGFQFHWSRQHENQTTHDKRTATICTIIQKISRVVFAGVAILMIAGELGVNIAPVLTGAGILGIAIGFGSQTLMKDILAGVFILLENRFSVGDVIEVNGKMGTVTQLDLRYTVLRGDNGVAYYVPNSAITIVANHTTAIAAQRKRAPQSRKKNKT